jgi:hypothetical protein
MIEPNSVFFITVRVARELGEAKESSRLWHPHIMLYHFSGSVNVSSSQSGQYWAGVTPGGSFVNIHLTVGYEDGMFVVLVVMRSPAIIRFGRNS